MGKRILIADDSVTIQKAFVMTLGAEDLTLTAARSADEGLTLARQTRPDLVIADATMPGRSGYELCAALKADATLRGTPVYILASSQQPYDEAKGRQVGADGHLLKPWDSIGLIDKLREALARGVASTASTAPAPRAAASLPAAAFDGDYGQPKVEAPRDTAREQPRQTMPAAATHAAPPAAAPGGGSSSPGMRPSLIPGVRPGAVPPARPGTAPARTLGPAAPAPGGFVPPRPAASPAGRTLFGLPAASMPMPGSMRSPAAPAHAPAAPAPAPAPAYARPAPSPAMTSAVSSAVDQKIAAIATRGPEYEAIAKLSREVIEQIVWEVVPELAELIIREHVEKRGRI